MENIPNKFGSQSLECIKVDKIDCNWSILLTDFMWRVEDEHLTIFDSEKTYDEEFSHLMRGQEALLMGESAIQVEGLSQQQCEAMTRLTKLPAFTGVVRKIKGNLVRHVPLLIVGGGGLKTKVRSWLDSPSSLYSLVSLGRSRAIWYIYAFINFKCFNHVNMYILFDWWMAQPSKIVL